MPGRETPRIVWTMLTLARAQDYLLGSPPALDPPRRTHSSARPTAELVHCSLRRTGHRARPLDTQTSQNSIPSHTHYSAGTGEGVEQAGVASAHRTSRAVGLTIHEEVTCGP